MMRKLKIIDTRKAYKECLKCGNKIIKKTYGGGARKYCQKCTPHPRTKYGLR